LENLFNQGSQTLQTDRQDYNGNTALCTKVHRALKTVRDREKIGRKRQTKTTILHA